VSPSAARGTPATERSEDVIAGVDSAAAVCHARAKPEQVKPFSTDAASRRRFVPPAPPYRENFTAR
jgi:hypothetical protein